MSRQTVLGLVQWDLAAKPSLSIGTRHEAAVRVDNQKFNCIRRRPRSHHLGRQPINLAECFGDGGVLADDRGLPRLVRSPWLHDAKRAVRHRVVLRFLIDAVVSVDPAAA